MEAIAAMPEPSRWSAPANAWALHPAKAKHRSNCIAPVLKVGGQVYMRRLILLCSALVLALITVMVAPAFLKAQGQPPQGQNPQAQQQGRGQGQGQGQGQGRGRGGRGAPTGPSKPTPRWPDGHPMIGAPLGEKGIWGSCCGSLSNAQTPYQPWAKALYDYRRNNEFEPHTRCKPSGGARQFVTPYGTEVVEMIDEQKVLIFDIGGPHTFREIFL